MFWESMLCIEAVRPVVHVQRTGDDGGIDFGPIAQQHADREHCVIVASMLA